ncbi:hypothetical protein DID88_009103 [Monilinia fructigena]|uniref:Chromo domain-containing protein n=1 Tax=Monilinia fructigena TaxID=38457 RepID=A0A395IHG5_9HELO|nr:hypothetical protein DID88_002343 [Monilinia fructigena]RAL58772.1 hypothetical protein DID88_009186 [Monilinia fructigena]RAL58793.1 hypothetical protein DID88_009103 [Monilinia fructigena]
MTTFDPIFYDYVPTAPRFKSATAQHAPAQKQSSIPNKTECIEPNSAPFDSTRQVAVVVSADDDPGYGSEIRGNRVGTTTVYSDNMENNEEDNDNRELPTTEELQYTSLRSKDVVPKDSSPDDTTRGDENIALNNTNNDCLWMKEITDPPSSEGILTERHQNSWGTQGRLLVLADNESDIPNLQATSVSTSAYLPDHEKLWDVEEGGFENEDPPIEQETLASMFGQDQPYSYQNPTGTSQNHINLLENDKSKQSASETASLYPLLTILDENSEGMGNKEISEDGTDLLLAFEKKEKSSATILGFPYSYPHFAELSHLHNDQGHEQSVISYSGSEELGDGSVPQQDHDVDQPEQQQHEEAPEEAVWEDDKNHHMMDGGKRKRTYQDKTNEIHSFEDSIPDTNSKDDNNPQPAKRRKPQLLPLDDASALSPKYNRKCRLRQRHSRSLPLTTQHEMNNGQSRNNCNHLLSFRNNDYSYASQTFRNSGDMIESVSIAEYHEWPLQGLIKCAMIENETTYKISLQLDHVPEHFHASILSKSLGFDTDNVIIDTSNTVNITGEDEWEVNTILAVRKRYNKLEYRADWLGVDEDSKYYPASDFKYSPHKIRDFHLTHPYLPGPPENLLKWIKKWEDGVDNYDELNRSKEMSQYSRTRFFRKGGVV